MNNASKGRCVTVTPSGKKDGTSGAFRMRLNGAFVKTRSFSIIIERRRGEIGAKDGAVIDKC